MGRPPSCELKKGSWTPEEDIILFSYIQQHGPGNWRSVPTNTGLLRCSKSCRLRWSNYLCPGIKRGNFTQREEKIIIRLQALLGNRWAAIASYLPQRTDNDIKNYWNTRIKKKLRMKLHNGIINEDNTEMSSCSNNNNNEYNHPNKGKWENKLQTDINMATKALFQALSLNQPSSSIPPASLDSPKLHHHSTTTYASSTENISKLLRNWTSSSSSRPNTSSLSNNLSSTTGEGGVFVHHSMFSSNSESGSVYENLNLLLETSKFQCENRPNLELQAVTTTTDDQGSLSLIEKWLFDDQGLV